RRPLMHRHHIRQGEVEKAVVSLQKIFEEAGEREIILIVKVCQPAAVLERREVNLVWPARGWGHESDPAVISRDGPFAARLAFDDIAIQAAPVLARVTLLGGQ